MLIPKATVTGRTMGQETRRQPSTVRCPVMVMTAVTRAPGRTQWSPPPRLLPCPRGRGWNNDSKHSTAGFSTTEPGAALTVAAAALCHCHRCSGGVSHSAVTAKERLPIEFSNPLTYDVGEILIRQKRLGSDVQSSAPQTGK